MTGVEASAAKGYAGDVTPDEAWRVLSEVAGAQLVDVRTAAEWTYVGLSDLSSLGKEPLLSEWQSFPDQQREPGFVGDVVAKLKAAGAGPETPVFFLCRSGARSASAARALTQEGFTAAYNVAGGFEGDLDEKRHRAGRSGWKVSDLPWAQS